MQTNRYIHLMFKSFQRNNESLFFIIVAVPGFYLWQNVSLRGIAGSSTNLVRVENGFLTMYTSSKITGHTTTSQYGAVYVTGGSSSFEMWGGEISENHSVAINSSGGVYIDNGASFDLRRGSITGNTRGNPAAAMDVSLNGTVSIARSTRGINAVVGASTPASFAGN